MLIFNSFDLDYCATYISKDKSFNLAYVFMFVTIIDGEESSKLKKLNYIMKIVECKEGLYYLKILKKAKKV